MQPLPADSARSVSASTPSPETQELTSRAAVTGARASSWLARAGFFALGMLVILGAIPIAFVAWSLLPEGRYPVLLAVVPASSGIWVAYVCSQRSGGTGLI